MVWSYLRRRRSSGNRCYRAALVLALGLVTGCTSLAQPVKTDPWVAPDKGLHLLSGVALGAAGAALADYGGASACTANVGGIALGFTIGLGKEWHDLHDAKGMPSNRDLFATVIGSMLGAQIVHPCEL